MDIIVAGDLNVDWLNETFYKQKLQQIINDNGLVHIAARFDDLSSF